MPNLRRFLPHALILVAVGGLWLVVARGQRGRGGAEAEAVIEGRLRAASSFPPAAAAACMECHREAYDAWASSQHARANRLFDPARDLTAFEPPRRLARGDYETEALLDRGRPLFRVRGPDGRSSHRPEAVIAITPLRQYLVPFPGGRLQVLDAAFDPVRREWFDVNGDENRQPHEWGFWKNRSMTWNVQCAFCHTTGLEKNYDPATDSYATTWRAMGVACAQCHGELAAHLAAPEAKLPELKFDRRQILANCASCHSRREELTGAFRVGEDYYDHYRPTLVDAPGIYHCDGQIRDEDFEYGSFIMSRMGHREVMCLDCHNPHSGKLVLPADNNALCLSCHAPPGQRGATVIDPAAHSHHVPGTPGDRCVDCHMAVTHYMRRDPRRDHGFIIPDPVLTAELGVPNACNRCHWERGAGWAGWFTDEWYGKKMERRSRERARVVGRAQRGEPAVAADLLALAKSEEVLGWRASLVNLLAPQAGRAGVREYFGQCLADPMPAVRSAAVRALAEVPGALPRIEPLTADPSRLVRLDAVAATVAGKRPPPAAYAEYRRYLRNNSDQPAGALREAELALNEGRTAEAAAWARKAAAWDPSPFSHYAAGRILHRVGDLTAAETELRAAVAQEPRNAELRFTLGLFYGELNRPRDAAAELRQAVGADPQFGRAWYNLGLAAAAVEDLPAAVEALRRAEALLPGSPEPAYARATVHLRMKDVAAAREALAVALRVAPDFAPARQIQERLRQ